MEMNRHETESERTIRDFGEQWTTYEDNAGYYGSSDFLADILGPLASDLSLEGARIADIGAGTGFGMLKEGLQAYLMQRVATGGVPLDAAHLLYLSTLAGAEALGLAHEIGSFCPGKSADFVLFRAHDGSVLDTALTHVSAPEEALGALFTLGGAETVREVRVGGEVVYERQVAAS